MLISENFGSAYNSGGELHMLVLQSLVDFLDVQDISNYKWTYQASSSENV